MQCWQPSPAAPVISPAQVHAWRISLDLMRLSEDGLNGLLSPDEQSRASRFYFQRDRVRFVIAHGLLRSILGGYLRTRPAELCFSTGPDGKPFLAAPCGKSRLRFSMAHSDDLALIAIAMDRDVGIDLERITSDCEILEALPFFVPRERLAIQGLAPHLQGTAFFRLWTSKEAYLKATGRGLAALDGRCFSHLLAKPGRSLGRRIRIEADSRWSLVELDPGEGYAAAVVVEGNDYDLKLWEVRP
jgi:4'-phosphopantetheinyl transferase